jgi:hypothetical protein
LHRQRQVFGRVLDRADAPSRFETDGPVRTCDHPEHDARRLGRCVGLDLAGRGLDEIGAPADCQPRGVFDQAGIA